MLQSAAMSWLAVNFLSAFLLPPFSLLLLAGLGMALLKRRPGLGKVLIGTALALFYLAATPFCADTLLRAIEPDPVDPAAVLARPADAIVILGGGTYFNAPEYHGDTTGPATLERLRYGARLHRASGKPILVSGGRPTGNAVSEAAQMQAALQEDFRVQVAWREETSDNTLENARHSYAVLSGAGIGRIYLVTHAWHMKRAQWAFEQAGFEVVPAPTRYATHPPLTILDFLPRSEALQDSKWFTKELIGMVWYRLKSQAG
ncbi:MAG: YdcF family protein [Pseudomonadota bacterium]